MFRLVYVCRNQELRIPSAILRGFDFADEVVVLDRESDDSTAAIAEKAGAIVINIQYIAIAPEIAATLVNLSPAKRTLVIDLDAEWHLRDLPMAVNRSKESDDLFIAFKAGSSDDENIGNRPDSIPYRDGKVSWMCGSLDGLKALSVAQDLDTPSGLSENLRIRVIELPRILTPQTRETLTSASKFAQLFHWMLTSRHPLLMLGVPGLILFVVSYQMAKNVVGSFEKLDSVSLGVALVTFATTFCSILAIIGALILYVLGKQIDKMQFSADDD